MDTIAAIIRKAEFTIVVILIVAFIAAWIAAPWLIWKYDGNTGTFVGFYGLPAAVGLIFTAISVHAWAWKKENK